MQGPLTIGARAAAAMAQGLDVVVEAAKASNDPPPILFLAAFAALLMILYAIK